MESIRIAGPGLVALVHEIDACMAIEPTFRPLPQTLPCQVCGQPLKRAFDLTRYGRTAHLECPQEHGIYQSFMLFLAEKGCFRPYEWHDIHALTAAGKVIKCDQCGATLEARAQNAGPYCASPVGVDDPARLAAAIDRGQVAAPQVGGGAAACSTECMRPPIARHRQAHRYRGVQRLPGRAVVIG